MDKIPLSIKTQVHRWRKDPIAFGRSCFGFEPTEQQAGVMNDFAQAGAKVAVKAGHGVGKSGLMSVLAAWHVLLFPDSKAVATAPSATQLKDVLMSEIGKWISNAHPWIRAQYEYSSMRLAVHGREATQFLTARTARPEDPSALQGIHATHAAFFIDEAFGVKDPIFEVARGALSTKGSRVLMCGNPTATTGYAFNAFHKNSHLWKCHTLSCLKSPLVDPNYAKEMMQEYGEDSDVYKVRVLGEFPSTSICQLISRELAESASKREYHRHQVDFAPVVLGVDVAWEGDDRSCIFMRQGLHSKILGVYRNIDNMRLGGLVNQYWNEYRADAVFIDVGWGTGVIDFLRSLGKDPIPVNFGGKSIKDDYVNKRTEMWCEGKKWLEDGGQIQDRHDFIEDLISPEVYFQPNGKKMLEQKKMMKKRGLQSPDIADAWALTFASPVQKRAESSRHGFNDTPQMAVTEYNPLG